MPEAEQGLNVARIASLRAGVPVDASAVTVNRFCASGLQAIAFAAERIMCGFADAIVAGGTESMSMVPMGGNKVSPNPTLVDSYPDVYLSTGLVAENHAREAGISRDEQDAFALRSHQRALAAIDAGRFADEITPLTFNVAVPIEAPVKGRPTTPVGHSVRGASIDSRGDVRAGRRAAARHVGCCPGEAQTGLPCERHGHRRQHVADQRRRRGRAASPRRTSRRRVACSRWRASSRLPPRASNRSVSASDRCRRSARRSRLPA